MCEAGSPLDGHAVVRRRGDVLGTTLGVAREAGEGHIGHPRWGIRLQKAPADDPCKDSRHDVYAQEMPPTCHRETSPPRSGTVNREPWGRQARRGALACRPPNAE